MGLTSHEDQCMLKISIIGSSRPKWNAFSKHAIHLIHNAFSKKNIRKYSPCYVIRTFMKGQFCQSFLRSVQVKCLCRAVLIIFESLGRRPSWNGWKIECCYAEA